MEYKKIIHLLDSAPNQPSKFGAKNWVVINDESNGICNSVSQIKFKTTVLTSILYDYSDAYIIFKGNM